MADFEIVNVSYDSTRELYQEIDDAFSADYQARTGKTVKVIPSPGGSGAQARAVIDGLKADVVTLALAGDVEAISRRGLIAPGWDARLPHHAAPYTSTVVLMVRGGNPKAITDWSDLTRPGIKIITPNPKTSGGARWNFLAAWGYVTLQQKKSDNEAKDFLRRLYANVLKLDTGSRGATDSFIKRQQGDVLIAWENEALLIRREAAAGSVEIVYPSVSILAEPPVAVVDKVVDRRQSRGVAEAYLQFLYSETGQEIIGKNGFRPSSEAVLRKHSATYPPIEMFTIREVAGSWENARARFFGDGGIFDEIYRRGDR